jgi:hypothetical protein
MKKRPSVSSYYPGMKVTQKNVGCVLARTRIVTTDAWLQATTLQ